MDAFDEIQRQLGELRESVGELRGDVKGVIGALARLDDRVFVLKSGLAGQQGAAAAARRWMIALVGLSGGAAGSLVTLAERWLDFGHH